VSRCFSSSSSNIQDEEDSIPDQLKEDRALNIAEGLKGDPIIHDLLHKEQTINSLDSFYNINQKEMSLLHHSFLLYRIN
jgi:hypothetical protein